VERLTERVRDPRAGYKKTLDVLEHAKKHNLKVITKTSLMLGLGETEDEVLKTMDDLRAIGVDIVTFGQYLQPTRNHLPVERWVTPEEFEWYREKGLEKGFLKCPPAPWSDPAIARTGCSSRTTWGSRKHRKCRVANRTRTSSWSRRWADAQPSHHRAGVHDTGVHAACHRG